jgi:hypothetical protein
MVPAYLLVAAATTKTTRTTRTTREEETKVRREKFVL